MTCYDIMPSSSPIGQNGLCIQLVFCQVVLHKTYTSLKQKKEHSHTA